MKNYHLTVLSPDGEVFNGDVISLLLRGAQGELAVYAGHIPFITTVRPGRFVLVLPDETEKVGELKSGILDVGKDEVRLLVGERDIFS